MRRRWLAVLLGLGLLAAAVPGVRAASTAPAVPAPTSPARIVPLQARVVSLQPRVRSIAPTQKASTYTVGSDVLFAFDSSALSPDAKAVLASVVSGLRRHHGGTVTVDGYTDSIGSDSFNLGLSRRRAAAVRGLLAAARPGGLDFRVRGYGEAHPVAPNTHADGSDNPAGRAKNRRVTVSYAPG